MDFLVGLLFLVLAQDAVSATPVEVAFNERAVSAFYYGKEASYIDLPCIATNTIPYYGPRVALTARRGIGNPLYAMSVTVAMELECVGGTAGVFLAIGFVEDSLSVLLPDVVNATRYVLPVFWLAMTPREEVTYRYRKTVPRFESSTAAPWGYIGPYVMWAIDIDSPRALPSGLVIFNQAVVVVADGTLIPTAAVTITLK